jgi:acetyl-CoA carboxylase biotin carboxyl carrier protein
MSRIPATVEGAKPEKKKKGASVSAKKTKVSPKLAVLQDVIQLMNEAQINELQFEQGGVKIHLRKGPGMAFTTTAIPMVGQPTSMGMASTAPAPIPSSGAAAPAPATASDNTVTVKSPMVGTFYRSPSPDSKPFIEEGAKIVVGQVYCIIEAMKLMNEVKSEVAGKVVKIVVQNGQAVEFNQPLIVVDPA